MKVTINGEEQTGIVAILAAIFIIIPTFAFVGAVLLAVAAILLSPLILLILLIGWLV